MASFRKWRWIAAWLLLSLALVGILAWALLDPEPSEMRAWFAPGPMTHGHHQIELACGACHSDAFGGGSVLQESCVNCHGEQLALVDDSHPKSKFTDPRNLELVKKLDGRACVSCHTEHRPDIVGEMGVSLPADFCVTCHADVGKERPTHAGMGFETCASAGCHNYHDNRALYEDFLLEHAQASALTPTRVLPMRDFAQRWIAEHAPVAATAPDHPTTNAALMDDWLASSHAQAGVQCSGCHAPNQTAWRDKPDDQACTGCHEGEVKGFLQGKHGMRLAAELSPMTPGMARQPMHAEAAHQELGCTSCHGAHTFDTRRAAVESCLGCHADEHSLAYRDSQHFKLWQQEVAGEMPAGSGVSCASCHMPRIRDEAGGVTQVHVQHNQNDSLRPNEGMIRPVCQSCHGLSFAIDALADTEVIRGNFAHPPKAHIESIDMAVRNAEADRARRAQESP